MAKTGVDKDLETKADAPETIERIDSEISELTEDEQRQLVAVVSERIEYEQYIAPIPPPSFMAGYERVLPGAADRILSMAEEQSKHRQAIEKTVVESNARAQMAGVVTAGIIALTVIIGGVILISVGRNAEGFASIIAALAALVGVFIKGRSQSRAELKEKSQQLDTR